MVLGILNPFAPGDFAEKRVLKLVEWFSGHCYKELKLTTNQFTGRTLGGLLIQMQNISLRSSGMQRKLFAFLASFFFSLAGHLVGFILVGRVFRKAFRILGLGERKGRWAMEQDFHGDFQVNVTWFFASFSGVLDWIVLILVWFERPLHSTQVSEESCPWPLKLMTSQRVKRTWIRTGGYGQFRGEWVNKEWWNFEKMLFIFL